VGQQGIDVIREQLRKLGLFEAIPTR
jgi:hypothetical protein